MPRAELAATVDGEWGVLEVSGEVDLAAGPPLRTLVNELLRGGVRHLVVDLARASFLDSVGLGVLLAAAKRLRGGDPPGSLRLAGAGEQVAGLFELTGLLGMLPLYATVEAARAAGDPPAAAGAPGRAGGG
jgi:anti-sigma B factor antagonist